MAEIPKSRRQLIVEWFRAQLEAITVANGFATDAGNTLYAGYIPQLGEHDPDVVIAMTLGVDQLKWQGNKAFITLPISISVCARSTDQQPWDGIERVLGDVKRSVEVTDRRLGGLLYRDFERVSTKTFDRESGSQNIGANVQYLAAYGECWGQPEA